MSSSYLRAGFLHLAIFIIIIVSCKKTEPITVRPKQTPPVARAGSDMKIFLPDDRVLLLDGFASYDPDGAGQSLTYVWSKLSGPDVQYLQVDRATVSLVVLDSGTYQFELQVKDVQENVARDTITVSAVWGPSCKPGTEMFRSAYGIDAVLAESVPLDVSVASGQGNLVFAGGRAEQDDGWGGYDLYTSNIYVYDLDAKTTIKKELSLARGRIGIAIGTDEIFFAGGILLNGVSSMVDIYNRRTGTMEKSGLSVARSSVSCGLLGNKVFFAGGRSRDNEPLDVVDIYDMSTKTWTVAKLSVPRDGISVVSSDSKIFFAGGNTNLYTASGRVDIYDLKTGVWSVAELPEPRYNISSAWVGNTIVFAGGRNEQSAEMTKKANLLDLSSMAISSECIVSDRLSNTVYSPSLISTVLNGNELYHLNNLALTRFEANSKKWSISVLPYDKDWVGLAASGTKLFAISSEVDNTSNGYWTKLTVHRVSF